MPDNTLQHVGVLGMKWGRRKASGPSSSDHAKASVLKKKATHEMSNEELKTLSTRLQLEKSVKDLSKSDVSSGKKFVTNILLGAGGTVATLYATQAIKVGVESVIKSFTKVK